MLNIKPLTPAYAFWGVRGDDKKYQLAKTIKGATTDHGPCFIENVQTYLW